MTNALTIIDKARKDGALVYAPQNLETPPLYKIEVSEIKVQPNEFHNMKGKFMPNRAVTDRIGEAAGVDFIASECSVIQESRPAMPELGLPARTVFVGMAQGRTRLPDGSWRYSAKSDYEFDPILRAKTEGKGDREALEYMKFARQRASTGARLAVIRQLVGMPVTFSEDQIKKPLFFSRVVQNTDYVLSTPEGKTMAIAMATGAAQMMYGKQIGAPGQDAQSDPEDLGPIDLKHAEDQQTIPASGEFDSTDPELGGKPSTEPTEAELSETLFASLEQWLLSEEITKRMKAEVELAIHRNESDPKTLKDLLDKVIKNQKDLAEYKRSGKVPS